MARIRTIKPSFWTDERLAQLPRDVRLTFIGLISSADDEGRLKGDPRLIKASVYPLDDDITPPVVEKHLAQMAKAKVITRYKVEGNSFIVLPKFKQHQKINRAQASVIPAPPDSDNTLTDDSVNAHGGLSEDSLGEWNGMGEEEEGICIDSSNSPESKSDEQKTQPASSLYLPEFDLTWNAYPSRAGSNSKKGAFKGWRARRLEGESVDALHDGTLRYNAWCVATAKVGTEWVMQGTRFYGVDREFANAWDLPLSPSPSRDANAERLWSICKKYGLHHCTRTTIDGELARARDAGDVDDPEAFKAVLRRLDLGLMRNGQSDDRIIASIAERLTQAAA